MQRRAKRRTSARMDQWTRSLSKVAPQSRICVKTWTLPYSGQAFDRLYRPTAGQDMRHQRGHFQWQTTYRVRSASARRAALAGVDGRSLDNQFAVQGLAA